MNLLKKTPLPMAGLTLGGAALGNLLNPYGAPVRLTFGCFSTVFIILIIIKIILKPSVFVEMFNKPPVAGILATIPMTITILSSYAPLFSKPLGLVLWWLGLILHVILIVAFSVKYVLNFKFENVFPSWFVLFVGIVCSTVTAPIYEMQSIGKICFWFGFIIYMALLPLVSLRILKRAIATPALPTMAIFAAPASLLLAGYNSAFTEKNSLIIWLLSALSIGLFIFVMTQMPKLLALPFSPGYSAYTFPFVITAIALVPLANTVAWFKPIHMILVLWVVIIVVYVAFRYLRFLFVAPDKV